jgi:hypothetical protein
MPLATGSRTQLRYIPETTYGAIPVAGTQRNLRRTDDSLGFRTQSKTSEEIRGDRQTTDNFLVSASAEGGLNFELSYQEYDTLMAAAFQGAWSVYGTNGVGTAISSGTWTATTFTGTSLPITNLTVGQWVRIATTTPGGKNDGRVVQISKTVAPSSTVITFEANSALETGAAVSFSLQGSRLSNGVIQPSFSLEREHGDITQFLAFRGMVVSKLSLSLQSGDAVTGAFDFMGKDQLISTTTQLPGAQTQSKTFDVINCVTGVGDILEGGSPLTGTYIKSMTFDIDNKLRGRDAIGYLGNVDIGAGAVGITGNLSVYFANTNLYNKFLLSTRTSLSFRMFDPSGNGYVVTLPSVKFSAGDIKAGTKDADSMVDMTYEALMDPTFMKMVFVDRVGVAAT